jgi:hypothetical protein
MQIKLSGSVHYANGVPVPDVVVRIYDKDAAGKQDDDLTINPGLSDEQGNFELVYEPLRYLDYHNIHLPGTLDQPGKSGSKRHTLHIPDITDVYLPYLRFYFTFNGINRQHTAALGLFRSDFYLPVNPPVSFLPSRDAFKFANNFPGYFLPYSPPAFLTSRKVSSKYGLCGGMCAVVYDFLLVGKQVPQDTDVPRRGSRLQRYLFQRQMDSLGGLGQQAIKVAHWTSLPDGTLVGTQRRTADEFSGIRSKLDDCNLVVLALIYEHATSLIRLSKMVFSNHQVLAYAYQVNDEGGYDIQVYDPNLPSRDDVVIRAERVELGATSSPQGEEKIFGLKSTQLVGGEFYKTVRGFFEMPYSVVKPPDKL